MRGEEDCGEQAVEEDRKKSEDCDICHGNFLSFSVYVHTLMLKTGTFNKEKNFLR